MATIALEVVPPATKGGDQAVREEGQKVRGLLDKHGLTPFVNTIVLPNIIREDGDRPVALEDKIDPADVASILSEFIDAAFVVTQVTVFTPKTELEQRLRFLLSRGIDRLVFVGEPRELGGRPLVGPFPNEALTAFRDLVPHRGAILIPTRVEEDGRFLAKAEAGANFGLTQLLYSDYIGTFLKTFAEQHEARPEILMSFGYVPKAETTAGLVRWLIHDPIGTLAQTEIDFVGQIADLSFDRKKAALVDLYKRVVEGAVGLGFPLGVHFESPYGNSEPAMETFRAMLDVWAPTQAFEC